MPLAALCRRLLLPGLAAAVLLSGPRLQAAEPIVAIMDRGQEAATAPEPADEILAAAVYEMKGTPVLLRVDAAARTSRPGHVAGVLMPHLRTDPPADGIYELTFYTFPSRSGGQSPDRIEALNFWKTFPADLKGVRVYAAKNCIEAFIHQKYANLASGRCIVAR
jgi:hypothetical protein